MKSINPYTTRLNAGNAQHMALCARAVYEDTEIQILHELNRWDKEYLSVKLVDVDGSQAALIEHDQFLCYSFRGTDEKRDWLTNINAFPDEWQGGKYHRGFISAFADVWAELNAAYWERRREQKRPIFLTGHSLGGAMATCCAAHFNYEDWPFMSLYTFGSPRCVEKHTAREFNMESRDRTFRFQNSKDIVTRMPARAMGYSHTGINLFIDQDGIIQSDPGFWARFTDFISVGLDDLLDVKLDGVEDHDMGGYLKLISLWKYEA